MARKPDRWFKMVLKTKKGRTTYERALASGFTKKAAKDFMEWEMHKSLLKKFGSK